MYQRILVPIDGSAIAAAGLDEAIGLAKLTGATICLVHVVEITLHVTGFEPYGVFANDALPAMEKAGSRILEQARDRVTASGVAVETQLLTSLTSRVCELVVAQAKSCRADLVVIGTHGRRGMDRFMLGSDAEQILRLAPVPVLLVRQVERGSESSGHRARQSPDLRGERAAHDDAGG
jgi:nucleotide-binding universal stress UspA family protein